MLPTTTLNIDTTSTASKDSGLWDESEVTGFNWEASSESLGAPDEGTPVDISYEALMDMALAAQKVPIIAGIPKNKSTDGVPEGGWTAPDGSTTTYYKGQNGDNMTVSATFKGVGKLEKMKTPAA